MEVIGRDKCKKDTYMLKTLLNMFKRKQINKDNPLQREPDQWSMQRQGGLVASVIKGEDVDSIKLCEQLIGNLWIIWLIDGLQRLTTLEKYSNNAFPISKKQKMPYVYYQRIGENGEREVIEYDLRGKYYSDLPDELKDAFDSYPIDVVKQLNCTNEELGYMDSLQRRFANLNDITVNNVLFSNKSAAKRMIGADDIFGQMERDAVVNPKKFSKVEEISAQDFIDKVLPTAKEIEAFVENKHEKNFVSMIAPVNPDAKTMFKWNNGLSWAYAGNITDSDMRQNVKAAGGNVDGVLRFSIMWNEEQNDNSDLDAHCIEPDGNEIYYGHCRKPNFSECSGQLDVDITHPSDQMPGRPSVENITWVDMSRMKPGVYRFFVNQFSNRGSKGFKAEVEFNGEIFACEYNKPVRQNGDVQVAEVTLSKDGVFSIKEKLSGISSISSRKIWNVDTNQFTPVSVISYSPNYFDDQNGIGHKHLFFFLKGCKNSEEPNGYYNEFLKNDLEKHKRVFEALGAKCHVENTDDQLSGIGFSMTKRADLVVKIKGATERVMKIKF